MNPRRAAGYRVLFSGVCWLLAAASLLGASAPAVKMWEEKINIPTYLAGDPEPNPIFYFGRASQGAEGRVYPYPLYDTLTNQKVDKSYTIVYLENEYVRIGILPEIGGRLFEGLDKTNNYDFIYRQQVIKPALIGLIGAWISGGIEWNIPHHHRASTFIPVQHRTEENADGSKTLWVGELEVRHRTRWAVGYTLHPGRCLLEAKLRIVNRTPVVNTMLCFANVAVHANENYQVIFPPGTQYATHHSKREFTTWPIATSRYGGYDFSAGVDVSWYKNHVAANSMFAWNYSDDFFAGYDHGRQAGTMSVADHHIVPGKKLWTWGNGPRGRMWDKILTDQDGPYIELMVGSYSDNQPDYSWLQPDEAKSFSMYWYPFRDIGGVKKANLEAAVNLETAGGTARLGLFATAAHTAATVALKAAGRTLLEERVAISPGKPYVKSVPIPAGVDARELRASLTVDGRELIAYAPAPADPQPMPKTVQPPPAPKEIPTIEELYLAGLRIEQFHNPTLEPEPYWEEALSRDPGDARVNTALGITGFKKARFADAERFFRKAVERLADRYTTPKDGEAAYYLGLTLKAQGRLAEAFDTLYKATWSAAWRAPAYCALAETAAARGDFTAALGYADRSLEANGLGLRAANLKAALLRRLGRPKEALAVAVSASGKIDPLDVRSMAERWLASGAPADGAALAAVLNAFPATACETAAEYLNAGLWQDGMSVLEQAVQANANRSGLSPMVYYYLATFAHRLGQEQKAAGYYRLAAQMPPEYVFPFQYEAIEVLRQAIQANPQDGRAPYYLGNLLYDWQPGEAVRLWEQAVAREPAFPMALRNLAIAYSHAPKGNDLGRAVASLEKAVSMTQKHALHLTELDELYEAAGAAPAKRLDLLDRNREVASRRDDALSRHIGLKVFAGEHDQAIQWMTGRRFSVWEGGSLEVLEHWINAHLQRGQRRLAAGQPGEALADFQAAAGVPENLPTERRVGNRQAEVSYWTGSAYQALGKPEQAAQAWREAAAAGGSSGGAQRYYQARALQQLGEKERAQAIFRELAGSGGNRPEPPATLDTTLSYAEVQSQRRRLADARYAAGLGRLGSGEKELAREAFQQALQLSPDHQGAKMALEK